MVLERLGVKDGRLPWDWLGDRAFGLKPTWVVNDAEGRGLKVDGRVVKVRLRDESMGWLVRECWKRSIKLRFHSGTLRCVQRLSTSERFNQSAPVCIGGVIGSLALAWATWFILSGEIGGLSAAPNDSMSLVDRVIYGGLVSVPLMCIAFAWAVWGIWQLRADGRSFRIDDEGFEILEGLDAGSRVRWDQIERVDRRALWKITRVNGDQHSLIAVGAMAPLLECLAHRIDPEFRTREIARLKRSVGWITLFFLSLAVVLSLIGAGLAGRKVADAMTLTDWRAGGSILFLGAVPISLAWLHVRMVENGEDARKRRESRRAWRAAKRSAARAKA
ncbi:MAG: hypothetical protein IBJ18_09930 [Phycisphaerales bacterium]|nr:hypothetical protein [Phycisphaerales bacterium]